MQNSVTGQGEPFAVQPPTVRDIVAAIRHYDKLIKEERASCYWIGLPDQELYCQPTLDRIEVLKSERAEWQAAFDQARVNLRRAAR